jgi:hypothetical protein
VPVPKGPQLQYPADACGAKETAPTRAMAEDNLSIMCDYSPVLETREECIVSMSS